MVVTCVKYNWCIYSNFIFFLRIPKKHNSWGDFVCVCVCIYIFYILIIYTHIY